MTNPAPQLPAVEPGQRAPISGQSCAQVFVPTSSFAPLHPYPRRRIAADLPRTRGRHPRLTGASLNQLAAATTYRNRRGEPTVYAFRAALRLLRTLHHIQHTGNLPPTLQLPPADTAHQSPNHDR